MTYRDNLDAALARLNSLEPKENSITVLPSKKDLFQKVRDLFISQPERWTKKDIGFTDSSSNCYITRDGWVLDLPTNEYKNKMVGFYLTGCLWIRMGLVEGWAENSYLDKVKHSGWVYIFCPRFRREIRKRRNWLLLKGMEK